MDDLYNYWTYEPRVSFHYYVDNSIIFILESGRRYKSTFQPGYLSISGLFGSTNLPKWIIKTELEAVEKRAMELNGGS